MRFNPKARLDTGRIRDSGRRGGGGGSMGLPIPGGKLAGGGVGGVVLVLLFVVLATCGGVDLSGITGTGAGGASQDTSRMAESDTDRYAHCATGADAQDDIDCRRVAVENSLYDYWSSQFDTGFTPATMQTFTAVVATACGQASSQVGPFYCPSDQTIYLDTTFFDEVLERQLGGPSGAFVEPYVLAHEYGHHIQNLLGTMSKVRTQQGPRSDAVRLELQADCYAGLWARAASTTEGADGEILITDITGQDIEEAIAAAEAVGDDRIQAKTQGQVTQESWTHGSAASRVRWFQTGFRSGDVQACDTWAVDTP